MHTYACEIGFDLKPQENLEMYKALVAVAIAVSAFAYPAAGIAKGCLKGAAVGGVAGHVAGHHGLVGATAGCVIEHHREKVRDQKAAQPAAPVTEKNPSAMRTTDTTQPK